MNLIRYIQGFGGQSKILIRFSLDPGRQTENGLSIVITLIFKMYMEPLSANLNARISSTKSLDFVVFSILHFLMK